MILVDTSVVVDCIRNKDKKLEAHFRALPTATCGVIRAEVLSGSRSTQETTKLIVFLNAFHPVPILEATWDVVGVHRSFLRSRGITVALPDVAIASLALINNYELWSRDTDHILIQSAIPQLRLFPEPP